MSLTRALAWNTGVQLLGKLLSTAFGVIIVGIMTRYLGQTGFGAYSTANAFLQVFALLLDLGLNVTLVSLLGEHAGDQTFENRCVSALFTLRLLMALLILGFVAPLTALAFPYPLTTKLAIIALSGSFIFPTLNQIVIGVQQRHLKMVIASSGEILGRVILLAGLLIARSHLWGLVPITLFVSLGSAANFLFSFLLTRRFATFRWNWDPEFWAMSIRRTWPIGVSIAFNVIYYKADTLVLSLVRQPSEVGIYGAAYRVLEILITVPFMYAGVVLPILSRQWAQKNRERFGRIIGKSLGLMMLLLSPLIAGTLLFATNLMTLVAGADFAAAGDVLRILIFAVGVIYLNTMLSHAIVASLAQRQMLPVYIIVAVVTLTGYVTLIPPFGLWAAAWLTVFSESCIFAGSLLITRRLKAFAWDLRPSLVAIFAAAVMALALYPLRHAWLPEIILLGATIYGVLVYALGGISKQTVREILTLKKDNSPPVL